MLCRESHCFRAIGGAKFAHNRADMKFGRALADHQVGRNLFIWHTLGKQTQHLQLALRQLLDMRHLSRLTRASLTGWWTTTNMPQELGSHNRLKQRAAFHRQTNGMEDLIAGRTLQQIAICPGLNRIDNALIVVKRREDDDARWVREAAQMANRLNAIHDGHLQIEQNNVWLQ